MYEDFQNGDCRTLNQALYPVELHSLHAPGVDLELSVSQGASPDMLDETILHCTAYLTSLAPGHSMLVLTKMPPKRSYYSPEFLECTPLSAAGNRGHYRSKKGHVQFLLVILKQGKKYRIEFKRFQKSHT